MNHPALMKLSKTELASVLAGQRLLESKVITDGIESIEVIPWFHDCDPLNNGETNGLCEKLNMARRS